MNIFDSHCHLDDGSFDKDLDAVIDRARNADVNAMMVVGINAATSKKVVSIANQYKGLIAAVGVHPHDAKGCNEDNLSDLKLLASDPKVRAWGETGLDYNRMFSPKKTQEHWFVRQLEVGSELHLPMIFHERDSKGRFLEILRTDWAPHHKGVVHCFSGSTSDLKAYLDMGLFIGITGIITIKTRGEDLRRMIQYVPSECLLVETDSPYLTPTPERNKYRRNEPAFVRTILYKLAAVRQEDPNKLANIIWNNSRRLFGEP